MTGDDYGEWVFCHHLTYGPASPGTTATSRQLPVRDRLPVRYLRGFQKHPAAERGFISKIQFDIEPLSSTLEVFLQLPGYRVELGSIPCDFGTGLDLVQQPPRMLASDRELNPEEPSFSAGDQYLTKGPCPQNVVIDLSPPHCTHLSLISLWISVFSLEVELPICRSHFRNLTSPVFQHSQVQSRCQNLFLVFVSEIHPSYDSPGSSD